MNRKQLYYLPALLALFSLVNSIRAGGVENLTIELAETLLHQMVIQSGEENPGTGLTQAQGILIVPQMSRGGHDRRGGVTQGLFLIRLPDGSWSNPLFVRYEGPRQVQEETGKMSDLLIMVQSRHAVQQLLQRKQTLGVHLSIHPVNSTQDAPGEWRPGDTSAIWDPAGKKRNAAIEGASITIDPEANKEYYRLRDGTAESILVQEPPPATRGLTGELTRISTLSLAGVKRLAPEQVAGSGSR